MTPLSWKRSLSNCLLLLLPAFSGGAEDWPSAILHPRDASVMVYVPPGPFLMGSRDGWKETRPEHEVDLPGFYIDQCEVSVSQFSQFIQAGGYENEAYWKMEDPAKVLSQWEHRPRFWPNLSSLDGQTAMFGLSYFEASAYCAWAGKALPTAEQWEKAARGVDGRVYPWGNEWDAQKSHAASSTHPVAGEVAQFPGLVDACPLGESFYGARQMSGNVWEWLRGRMEPYPGNTHPYRWYPPFEGVFAPELRGGSWRTDRRFCTTTFRTFSDPSNRGISFGFRGVCESLPDGYKICPSTTTERPASRKEEE